MTTRLSGTDRKAQIVSAAIDRLYAVGFEGFRLGDVARDVGINNATLVHHFPSKVALVKAVVEQFTAQFRSVAVAIEAPGTPRAKLSRHMQSSIALMQTSPATFVVLNEIMVRARRDADVARLVAMPLMAWQQHIIGLVLSDACDHDPPALARAHAIAQACVAQLLGSGLLMHAVARGEGLAAVDPGDMAVAAIADMLDQPA